MTKAHSDLLATSRRTFLKGVAATGVLTAAGAIGAWPAFAQEGTARLGEWLEDEHGLPCYRYTGPLVFREKLKDGRAAGKFIPDDPWFVLGNYRLTLFAHASGNFQIISGERAWARLNQGDSKWSGANSASVTFDGKRHELTGVDAHSAIAAEKRFGVGFAEYRYRIDPGLEVARVLSVRPSTKVNEGTSAIVVRVFLRNTGDHQLTVSYEESVRARYQPLFADWAGEQSLASYTTAIAKDESERVVRADVTAHSPLPMAFAPRGEMSRLDGYPPSLFVKGYGVGDAASDEPSTTTFSSADLKTHSSLDAGGHHRLGVSCEVSIAPGREKFLMFVVGYVQEPTAAAIQQLLVNVFPTGIVVPERFPDLRVGAKSCFGNEWRALVPKFADESDPALCREMQWNVHALEAMATYREYYDETVVPQGTDYDYRWGQMLSSRDLAQHALPLCTTNPALAKSVLRFIMKRMLPDGEIKLGDQGVGWAAHGAMLTSDQQLWFLMLMAEYLRATGDASILSEDLNYYPVERSSKGTGLERVRQAFSFLRDRISVGGHGLVRLWNSDWNDMFYFWPTKTPYNDMFEAAESLMNTAMAVAILGDMSAQFDAIASGHGATADLAKEVSDLNAAMRQHRAQLLDAFLKDWGTRPFPRRAYFAANAPVGTQEMWLEPQGFTLQIADLPADRRRKLLSEVERRLSRGEAMGARQIETPVAQPGTEAGSRENGGFWYALNGPLILGAATVDREAAWQMLKRMTFDNFSRKFPRYWTGQWSASDSLDSSLLPSEGLSEDIVPCAHAHAWPLYCYLSLRKEKTA